MITKLTDAQITKFPEYVTKWIAIGLSTEPAEKQKAEQAIIGMYKVAGLNPPKKIIWCGSPLSQGLTRAIILDKKNLASVRASVGASVWESVWESVRASVGESVWESVGESVRASVWESVRESVWESVRESVWESVGASVGASVWESVWESVRASVGASVGESVRESVGESVWESVGESVGASVWEGGYGQHDANWLGFYEYFAQECALKSQTEKLRHHMGQAKTAGWYLPHENICWISERHHILNRDERGRIHSIIGPAIAYPDGWSIYAVHGVRVPEKIITEKDKINGAMIDAEKNQEIRRVMLELYSLNRYFKEMKPTKIHSDRFGTLYRKQYPDGDVVQFVHVKNSTPEPDGTKKDYFLYTDINVKTAHAGVAATFGMTPDEYNPAFES